MRRFQLVELEDLAWWQPVLRNIMTDFLQYIMTHFEVYAPTVPLLDKVLTKTGETNILDLCSGGSGPWLALYKHFQQKGEKPFITLSDKYPNLRRFQKVAEQSEGYITYRTESTDAAQVPDELEGIRTIFTAFHHFAPQQAQNILRNAAQQRKAICIFEDTERTWGNVLFMLFFTPFFVWFLTTPFIRPMTPARIFWTYILPVIPFALMWDAVVSEVRSYSPAELKAMTDDIQAEAYTWEIGQEFSPRLKLKITYLLGYPAAS